MNKLDEIIKRVKNLTSEQQDEILETLKTWQRGRQREFQRLTVKSGVDMALDSRIVQTTSRDISAGGIFINTSGKFDVDQNVTVVFTIPGYDKPFKLKGRIVRVEKSGLAIEFQDITSYFKTILDDVIWNSQSED